MSRSPLARGASHASLFLIAAVILSCGKNDRVEIAESRPRHVSEKSPALDVAYEDSLPASDGYRWKLPAGWKEIPPDPFRRTNLSFGPNNEGECYVSIVNGAEVDNINRWRGQMALPEATEDEVATLPHKELFNRPAAFVDLTGAYKGAGVADPKENWRLVGIVSAASSGTVTVKMTGPADLVGRELPNFDAFLASLRWVGYPHQ